MFLHILIDNYSLNIDKIIKICSLSHCYLVDVILTTNLKIPLLVCIINDNMLLIITLNFMVLYPFLKLSDYYYEIFCYIIKYDASHFPE